MFSILMKDWEPLVITFFSTQHVLKLTFRGITHIYEKWLPLLVKKIIIITNN